MSEFDLIERIRQRVVARRDVVLGIGDDAALLDVPAGMQLVVAMDTLNAGVHFPIHTAAFDIGWKALAVNLSDLAAMGAQPAWCTLSLSLPDADDAWLDAFLDGFSTLASQHHVALVGGDTTRGPLSICVTLHGFVERGRALRRDGACVGDDVWVSGTLGDAGAVLPYVLDLQDRADRHDPAALEILRERLDRPTPRIALGQALVGIAHACIDVSDGLLADLAHIAHASHVGARIEIDALPASGSLAARPDDERRAAQATGGDDYELCFTASPEVAADVQRIADASGVRVTRIGSIRTGNGVEAVDRDGAIWTPRRRGFDHFVHAQR